MGHRAAQSGVNTEFDWLGAHVDVYNRANICLIVLYVMKQVTVSELQNMGQRRVSIVRDMCIRIHSWHKALLYLFVSI